MLNTGIRKMKGYGTRDEMNREMQQTGMRKWKDREQGMRGIEKCKT
jgi:hypothetical protein